MQMTAPNSAANERPVLTDMVDELLEFTDRAVQHSTEPDRRSPPPSADPVLSEVVAEVKEFTDPAVGAVGEVNGVTEPKAGTGAQTEPAP
jgi:hypothetical protein